MRFFAALILGLCAAAQPCAAASLSQPKYPRESPKIPSDTLAQGRLAAALREAVESPQAARPPAIRTEPAGDVAIDFTPNSRPIAVLEEALRLEQQREWRRAAELFQRLINEVPDELCRRDPRLYVPIRAFVEARIAAFPPEGLAAYRDQVGRQAEEMFQAAVASGDLTKLEVVATRFLLSSRGDDALDRLATAWLAHGEPGRALRAWQRLLRVCPDPDVDLRSLAVKLAACCERLGHPEAARQIVQRAIAVLGPEATIILGGRPIKFPELFTALGGSTLAIGNWQLAIEAPDPRSWPVLGGDVTQARIASKPVRPGALAWSDTIQPKPMADAPDPPSAVRRIRFPRIELRSTEPPVTVLPILAGGRTLFPARRGLIARDLETGKLLWEWPWPTEQGEGRAVGPFSAAAHAVGPFAAVSYAVGQWVCSASADMAFCSVPAQSTERSMNLDLRGELVALDLATGAVRWRFGVRPSGRRWAEERAEARTPNGPAADEPDAPAEAGAWFVAPPLPCSNSLVAAVRGGRGSEEYHLLGLRPSDGRVLWRTFLASRSSDPWMRVGLYQNWFEGMPAEAEGLVVACAAGGIVGAVELATGRVQWLARYDQWENRSLRPRSTREGWRTPGVAIADGTVYVAPPDSDFLYAFDLASGQTLWRREREGHRYFVGVADRRAYVAGVHASCLGPRGDVEWDLSLPAAIAGRPVLAGQVVHIPLAGGILFLDAATGDELAKTSWDDWKKSGGPTWSADIASGDLLIAGGRLHVATRSTLNVFEPLASQGDLERAVAAEPKNPAAHYALGLDRHWAGDLRRAAQSLERALALAERQPGAFSEAARADARRRLASCHEAIARLDEVNGRPDSTLESYRAALRYTVAGPAKSRLYLRIASLSHALKRWDPAVASYQDALAVAEMGGPSWERARAGVDEVLREAGREPYAPFEKQANAALRRAAENESRLKAGLQAESPVKDLLDVARLYPNSRAAPLALVRLAERSPAGEAQMWNCQLVRNHPDSPHAPAALHALAAAYSKAGARAMARGALATLRRKYPTWRPATEGVRVPRPSSDLGVPDSTLKQELERGTREKTLDPEAFLAAHPHKTREAAEAALSPPFRIEWNVGQDYGSSDLYVVGDPEASDDVLFLLAGRSFEARAVRDGSRRWADRPAWIGIRIESAERPGGGVNIVSLMPDAPAERAGLHPGDIIVSLDDQPVRDSEQLITTCSAKRAGTPAQVVILRDQERLTLPVTLGDRPSQRGETSLAPTAFLGLCGENALIRRPTRLDAIRAQDGHRAWSLPVNETDERASRPDQGRASVAAPGIAVWADARGRLTGIDPATARTLWTASLDDATPQDMTLWEHGLVVVSASPPALCLVNPFDGDVLLRAGDRQAVGAPVFALDTEGRLCYAMGSTLAGYDTRSPRGGRPPWSVRVPNFLAKHVWAAGTVLVAHGLDARGNEVFECRNLATGDPVWSLPAQGAETFQEAALEPDALYVVSRAANRTMLRRIETSTGKVAWTHEVPRGEELDAWEPSAAALLLGITATDDVGARQARVVALNKLTGAPQQRLDLGHGELVSLTRLGASIYAVFREDPRSPDADLPAPPRGAVAIDPIGEGLLERPQFRVIRIVGSL